MRVPLVCVVATVAVLMAAPAAGAAISCVPNGSTVEVTGEPDAVLVTVTAGGEIQVENLSTTTDCGSATASNTDEILVTAPPDFAPGGGVITRRIPGGLTDEPGNTDEIEVTVVGYPFAIGWGTDGDDELAAGRRPDGDAVANLDAAAGDDDVDLVGIDVGVMEIDGLGGEDVVSADGRAGTGAAEAFVDAAGDSGNDTLTGGGFLYAGPGDDSFTAVTGPDTDPFAVFGFVTGDVQVTLPGGTLPGMDGNGGTDTFTGITQLISGSGDDELVAGTEATTFLGGEGDDELFGGPEADFLVAGSDDDSVSGGGGDDFLGQVSSGPDGADVLRGGADFDRVVYGTTRAATGPCCGPVFTGRTAPLFVSIGDGPGDGQEGEGDDVQGDVEYVVGGSGNDTLIGAGGDDWLAGLTGSDTLDGRGGADLLEGDGAVATELADLGNTIIGGPGADELKGSEGPDDLRAADGEADSLVCGDGLDYGPFDTGDTLADDCEQRPGPVEPAPPPPPAPPPGPAIDFPADVGEPMLVRRGPPRVRRRRGGRFRLATGFAAACPANGPPCVVRVSLKVRRRGGKLFLTRKTRPVTLAAGSELTLRRLLTAVASDLLRERGTMTAILRATFRRGGGPLIAREAALILRRPGRARARRSSRGGADHRSFASFAGFAAPGRSFAGFAARGRPFAGPPGPHSRLSALLQRRAQDLR